MNRSKEPANSEPSMIRVADAARLADVSEDMVMRWISAGHLRVFVPPGHKIGDGQRGPKSVRILADDWSAFVSAHTSVGMGVSVDPDMKPKTTSHSAFNTEGPKRRNQRKSRRTL